ncbi:hypothetical protein [Mycobacterium lepromatosis]|uniref:hypothetical protein n=1 Tax=Mycobacterium lepromatosis TaxID=480418 RepID=UPI000ACEC866|nr:hypothetical protein [Mycobacterium lepromatosis]
MQDTAHKIKAHPQMKLNLDSNGDGSSIVAIDGTTAVVTTYVDGHTTSPIEQLLLNNEVP